MTVNSLREQALLRGVPHTTTDALKTFAKGLNQAHKAARGSESVGLTTATVVQIMPELRQDGMREVAWTSIGDSRLYYYDAQNGTITLVTRDEGEGNMITNAIGSKGGGMKQYGVFAGRPGDKLVLVSDGITGDYEHDAMEPGDMASILWNYQDSRQAATLLTQMARKIDDRSALVIEIPYDTRR